MHIHIRLAEPFWRVVGQRNVELALAEQAQVADMLSLLCQQYPALAQEMAEAPPQIFVGDEEAEPETSLTENARVHIVWAVAGG